MCTRYPIINRVSELKVHIELTRFVQPEKIEIDANEKAVNEKSQYCFFVCTTFDSFLNDLSLCFLTNFFDNIVVHQCELFNQRKKFPYVKAAAETATSRQVVGLLD